MIRKALASLVAVWIIGFALFAITLPQPMPLTGKVNEAVIVPTGGPGRIMRGLQVLRARKAPLMLVTGVDREVKPAEFAAQFEVAGELMDCCITLGFQAVDTQGNAREAAQWVAAREVTSIRLVTTDWHMRRAANELESALPESVVVDRDAVASAPSLGTLFLEYHKLIYSWITT